MALKYLENSDTMGRKDEKQIFKKQFNDNFPTVLRS